LLQYLVYESFLEGYCKGRIKVAQQEYFKMRIHIRIIYLPSFLVEFR